MSEAKHTSEPWQNQHRQHGFIYGADGKTVCQLWAKDETDFENCDANAERIVACVNALAGINPEAVPQMLQELEDAESFIASVADEYRQESLRDGIRRVIALAKASPRE